MSVLTTYQKDPHTTTVQERMRRFLLSTSYNHVCLVQLGLAVGLPHLETDEEKEALAKNLTDAMTALDLHTYLRTFIVTVTEEMVYVSVRATDLALLHDRVRDHPSAHEEVLIFSCERLVPHVYWDTTFREAFLGQVASLLSERRLSERRQRVEHLDVTATAWRAYEGIVPKDLHGKGALHRWQQKTYEDLVEALDQVFTRTGKVTFTTRTICTRPNGRPGWTYRAPRMASS